MPALEEILDTAERRDGGKIGLEPRARRAYEQDEFGIPEGLPGSTSPKRGRGRPAGSTNKSSTAKSSSSVPSETVTIWEAGAALTLDYVTAIIAKRIVGDEKYHMTHSEALSAAHGVIIWLFQYRQVRDIAVLTSVTGPNGAIIKGFMPYIMRVFIKDMILNVLNGPPLSQSIRNRRPKNQQSRTGFNSSSNTSTGVGGTAPRPQPADGPTFTNDGRINSSNGRTEQSATPQFLTENNWRDVG